ncbi:hypothetical protein PHLCEN_2v4458 [Hermanssonia centrifuga]|uniref:Uncharacterized protein n=1 Tax=Hermanssonia centrifuga TaxID=98765 RepID=A0A2R6PNH7_9APHY|nr:hypothetical protein PHLCEN_2v4458 [Hermanssonia centrifuga]
MAPVPSPHKDPIVQDEMFNRTVLTTVLCITGLVFLGMVVYLYWRLLRCSFKRQPPANTGRPLKKLVLLDQINQLAKPCRLLGFSSIPQDMEKAITVKDESRIVEGVSRPVQTNRSIVLAIRKAAVAMPARPLLLGSGKCFASDVPRVSSSPTCPTSPFALLASASPEFPFPPPLSSPSLLPTLARTVSNIIEVIESDGSSPRIVVEDVDPIEEPHLRFSDHDECDCDSDSNATIIDDDQDEEFLTVPPMSWNAPRDFVQVQPIPENDESPPDSVPNAQQRRFMFLPGLAIISNFAKRYSKTAACASDETAGIVDDPTYLTTHQNGYAD